MFTGNIETAIADLTELFNLFRLYDVAFIFRRSAREGWVREISRFS